MFERYTEKARRVIFFARYEASEFGSPYIETEHLLLGVVRECRDARRLFGDRLPPDVEIRRKIEELSASKPKIPVTVDLPLSNECKRVLAYGAEEAERMGSKHIGAEHLFLGLLREEKSLAARLLKEWGITLKDGRQRIVADIADSSPPTRWPFAPHETVTIHGVPYPAGYFHRATEYTNFAWQKQTWKARDILVDKQTGRVLFYSGQAFDPVRFELTKGGWNRDHCIICRWPLHETDHPEHGVGYTNGRDWVCSECHDKFLGPPITPLDDLYT